MQEETLFELALCTPAEGRAALLDRECVGQPELRARIEALLVAEKRQNQSVTLTNALDPSRTRSHHLPAIGEVGQLVAGRYTLVEVIGEGGMGSVWRAKQTEPIKRMVAVKLIKAGMDSKGVLARFEAERQAFAVMDHPNIAKILDGGLHENRPYFVMELVKGTPITEFCDARKLTPQQRLELFVPVCNAIQHAHQKGIIHRDIKPSNVLIALYDDKPVPKVIDFGIAKATGGALTEQTLDTGFGGILGTPQYMSPEQATFNNLDIDTRSDVYSLGVLLYELLVGTPPFSTKELEKRGLLEILRVVREDEPPRPSAKLGTASARASISANRSFEPSKLTGLLRGELDWIVMRAMEKDRTRRYETANGFAADVLRYLGGEAVQAHPPSAAYRLRKFVRRNKGRVAAGSAVAVTLCGGLVGTTWQAIRAEREAERVRAEEQNTRKALTQAEFNQQQAERFLVQSYLRPVGYYDTRNRYSTAELLAFSELAELSTGQVQPSTMSGDTHGDMIQKAEATNEDRLKLLCLREALANPETSVRVARHGERFMQAVVGSSLVRRQQALEILIAQQRDLKADVRSRFAACWLTMYLGSNDLPALEESCKYLKSRDAEEWETFFVALCETIFIDQQIHFLLDEFVPEIYSRKVSDGFYRVGPFGTPLSFYKSVGTHGCHDYFLKITETATGIPSTDAIQGLMDLSLELDTERRSRSHAVLAKMLTRLEDTEIRLQLTHHLDDNNIAIDPKTMSWIIETQLARLRNAKNGEKARAPAESLARFASRMDISLASKVSEQLAKTMTKSASKSDTMACVIR
jgi:serine/threonine protein kinase